MHTPKTWIITDGKAGDLGPCLALAHAAHWNPFVWQLQVKGFWEQLTTPYRLTYDANHSDSSPFSGATPLSLSLPRLGSFSGPSSTWPHVLIASGRRTIPIIRRIRKFSSGKTFTVFLKDPRTFSPLADFKWVPEHDSLRGPHVCTTLTTPHLLSSSVLQEIRTHASALYPHLFHLPHPRVAVLIGGNSRHHFFTHADQERLITQLKTLIKNKASLMITTSRRTPIPLKKALTQLTEDPKCLLWDGHSPNPYAALLALSDYVVVTTDSINMMGEALATGRPLLLFHPQGGHKKITNFTKILRERGYAYIFDGSLPGKPYTPLDYTGEVAQCMIHAFKEWENKKQVRA
jgi:mitochondrial fission protein ELM1